MEGDAWTNDMLPHEMVPMDRDCECKSDTMMKVHPREIPELIRVFYCLDNHKNNNTHLDFSSSCNRQVCKSGFDYGAAKELLERDPDQVQYVTYEYKKQRDKCQRTRKGAEDFCSCTTYTGTNSFLQSPLRFACLETTHELEAMEFLTAIRAIDPTQFLLQDSNGQLPIDGECVLNASIELLEFLLEIYLDFDFVCPNGVGMAEANFNPITCLCGSYWSEDIHQASEEIRSGNRVVSGKNVLEDNLGIENNFWTKITLLTKAFYHKTIEEDYTQDDENSNDSSTTSMLRITNDYADRRVEFRLLHACAGIDWFPPNLLRLLVAAFPEALLEKDDDGNLPIHVAAGGFFESYRTIRWDTSGDLEANSGYQKTTIDILLDANIALAKIPDAEGRLPLELAIESGLKDDGYDTILKSKRWRPWEDGGIGSLLNAYPEAAKIRSPVTGKLPLEITLGRGRDWEDGVRALLKAFPEASRIRNPRTGKYPLQLAIERETHFDKGVYALLEVSPEAAWAWCAVGVPEEQSSNRKRKRTNSDDTKQQPRKKQALLPLFAHAALENCSASVVYKLLRTNPESCRRCFENATTATTKNHRASDMTKLLKKGTN
eukprot:CAMPEP_0116102658 /NCGR_PEP_ID=MMETSP0327-20121206/13467_1 /TAXON_ID=44447 /ORGANISM="Pseudo-nitzschia delicatissima, Strain B596" /LENGTH=602 /DNA_ID=CAMNT_0003594713 /DNA_START=115 /DNA_END=1923 /DNA_ORIENTATION=+